MAQFVFKLDGVLRYRKNVEHQRQRDVAEIQAQMTALEAQLRTMDAEVQAVNADIRENALNGRIDTGFLIAHRRFLAGAQKQALSIAQKMGLVQVKLDQARKALAEAAKEHKILDKLRERQLEVWNLEIARKDAAAMDEVAMQISVRKMLAEAGQRGD